MSTWSPAAPVAAPAAPPRPRSSRVVGVDTARGLAVLGMFVAHLGLERSTDLLSTTGWFWIADGRSSALFATLAGAGLAFMTKRAYTTGDPAELRAARTRILKRSAVLMVLGWLLLLLGTPIAIILGAYAVLFLLGIPFLRMGPLPLLAVAAGVAVVMPTVVLLSRHALLGGTVPDVYAFTDAGQIALILPVVADLWSGYYPALSWLLYLLVGMAIGRMDLRRWTVQLALLLGGALLAAGAYLPGLALERTTSGLAQDLVTIEPHSGTFFEMVGNVGVAAAVVGLCLLLTTAIAPIRLLLTPVSATGSMSLTVYTLHLVYIAVLVAVVGADAAVYNPTSNLPLIALVLGSLAFATVWHLTLTQGPLERLLHRITRPAQPRQAPPGWGGGRPTAPFVRHQGPPAPPIPPGPFAASPPPPQAQPHPQPQPTPGYPSAPPPR